MTEPRREFPRPAALPELEPDAGIAVRRRVQETLSEVVTLAASVSPLFEMHRGVTLPLQARTADEALELLRASAHAEVQLREAVARWQEQWAYDAVLRGARLSDVAEALGMASSASVGKRWASLGAMRRDLLWFRSAENARSWAEAAAALHPVRHGLRRAAEKGEQEDVAGEGFAVDSEVGHLAGVCREYLDSEDHGAVSPTWRKMVISSQGYMPLFSDPRRIKATTEEAGSALDWLRRVSRAYRSGITVDDQVRRDRQDRAGQGDRVTEDGER